jgi:hypothetical protein
MVTLGESPLPFKTGEFGSITGNSGLLLDGVIYN